MIKKELTEKEVLQIFVESYKAVQPIIDQGRKAEKITTELLNFRMY